VTSGAGGLPFCTVVDLQHHAESSLDDQDRTTPESPINGLGSMIDYRSVGIGVRADYLDSPPDPHPRNDLTGSSRAAAEIAGSRWVPRRQSRGALRGGTCLCWPFT